MPRWLGFLIGFVLFAVAWTSVVFTVVLPRALNGPARLSIVINRATRAVFIGLSRLGATYEARDAILAPAGAVAVLAQLMFWLLLLGTAFVVMLVPYTHDLGAASTQVGAAMFTLGLGRSAGATNDALLILAGASGFVVIALQIAYLPVLYGAFNRREALITRLAGRAGEPSWGPEILVRHQLVQIVDSLPEFYGEWEEWAAELSESHSSYPVLLLFRSPDAWSSWVLALLAVLDAAAMHLALNPSSAPSQARLCLRMGYIAFRRISDAVGRRYDPDPMPDAPIQLRFEDFARAVALLDDVGFAAERSAEEAWPHFRGWRVNYEALAYWWADRVLAPPAPWSGSRTHFRQQDVSPVRPPHRAPGSPDGGGYERPAFDV